MLHILLHGLKALAWIGENLPDSARVGWSYLLTGLVLICAFFVPARIIADNAAMYGLQWLVIVAGIVCAVLGAFVFFRKAVWKLQERRSKRSISLFDK